MDFFSTLLQLDFNPHSILSNGYRELLPGYIGEEREADNSSLSNAESKKA
jgi:hypothetical protein